MSKWSKAKVDDLLATESYWLHEQKIHKIRAALEAHVYGPEMVSTTKRSQFEVLLNRAQQAATSWSDADCDKAIERLEHEINQVIPAQLKLFDKLFQHHEWQLLQEVGTQAIDPRSIFAKEHALMKTTTDDEAYGVANMTTDKWQQVQIHVCDLETVATTWSLAGTERVTNQLEWEINSITSNEYNIFNQECSICSIEFEAWWETIGIRRSTKPFNNVWYIPDIQRCILWAIYHSQFGAWVSVSILPLIFLNGYISPTWKSHIHLATTSITFDRCSRTMTSIPVLNIWTTHCHILHSKAGTILNLQMVSIDCPLPINGEVHTEAICYISQHLRTSPLSTLYHSRYTIWEKLMSAKCAKVLNQPPS